MECAAVVNRVLASRQVGENQEITISHGGASAAGGAKNKRCRGSEFELWGYETELRQIDRDTVHGAKHVNDVVGEPDGIGTLLFLGGTEKRWRFQRRGIHVAKRQKKRFAFGQRDLARDRAFRRGPIPDLARLVGAEVEESVIEDGMPFVRQP